MRPALLIAFFAWDHAGGDGAVGFRHDLWNQRHERGGAGVQGNSVCRATDGQSSLARAAARSTLGRCPESAINSERCACSRHSAARIHSEPPKMSEDCLFLNVWTAATSASDRRPVMVWIHPGGYQTGSGSTPGFDGEALAKKGVVLVTINYRLGVFGFFSHPELTKESEHHASGNYALMDQAAALRWVQKNIAGFGGDPQRVTVFRRFGRFVQHRQSHGIAAREGAVPARGR